MSDPHLNRPEGDAPDTPEARLDRCEELLRDIRDRIARAARESQYEELSLGRVAGGLAQLVAAGLLAMAVAEWALVGATGTMYTRLAFAGVVQLVALTGFAAARGRNH
ncbi:MAG: hypothetical protein HRU75_04230 [Planctomycetia bacterium]|nr:MAG: hypothetical protein HRU75_04230 [Planctomycetia bacterium]